MCVFKYMPACVRVHKQLHDFGVPNDDSYLR